MVGVFFIHGIADLVYLTFLFMKSSMSTKTATMQTNKRNPLGLGKNLDEWINASLSRGVLQQIKISLPNLG